MAIIKPVMLDVARDPPREPLSFIFREVIRINLPQEIRLCHGCPFHASKMRQFASLALSAKATRREIKSLAGGMRYSTGQPWNMVVLRGPDEEMTANAAVV